MLLIDAQLSVEVFHVLAEQIKHVCEGSLPCALCEFSQRGLLKRFRVAGKVNCKFRKYSDITKHFRG